ncbi:MAG: hypothetical protein FVQ83_05165 [Chloroflexi bacterium]|nr:hypothetical protein [Chloroflexota bacterium]
MSETIALLNFADLYSGFQAPISEFDCGKKCAPHNPGGKPFCCDTCHAVPTVYHAEWDYLEANTDLWHIWRGDDCADTAADADAERARLQAETPDDMRLVACLGPDQCQRDFRGLTCRQFPFYPYLDSSGEFLGLSYYWEYEYQCWVISNLHVVQSAYREQFIKAFEQLFSHYPEDVNSYQAHSEEMRDKFNKQRRAIPLLHRNGFTYKISTHNERLRRVTVESLAKFGPYKIAAELPFPEETV